MQNGKHPNLLQKRENALSAFEKIGLPSGKNEEYKYTAITKLLNKEFTFLEENAGDEAISKEALKRYYIPGLEANVIVFLNGKYIQEQSTIISPQEELVIRGISEADADNTENLGQESAANEDPFKLLNSAFAETGIHIRVPKGKVVEKPVVLYFLTDANQGKIIQHTKNIIKAEKNSEIKVITYFGGKEINLRSKIQARRSLRMKTRK